MNERDVSFAIITGCLCYLSGMWWAAKGIHPYYMALTHKPPSPVELSPTMLRLKTAYTIDPLMRARLKGIPDESSSSAA